MMMGDARFLEYFEHSLLKAQCQGNLAGKQCFCQTTEGKQLAFGPFIYAFNTRFKKDGEMGMYTMHQYVYTGLD